MDVRKMRNEKLGARVVEALNSRNMEAYYVETKEEAVKKALELIPKQQYQHGRCNFCKGVWSLRCRFQR